MKRTLVLSGNVEMDHILFIISEMERMDAESNDDIFLIVDSFGGCVASALALYEASRNIKSDIVTIGVGKVMSAGLFIVATIGTEAKRLAMPNTQFMYHEVRGFGMMDVSSVRVRRIYNQRLLELFSKHTGSPVETLRELGKRDTYKFPEEIINEGLGWIDAIVQPQTA